MPVFTIETAYHLPVYRQRVYEAPTLEEACRLAIGDEGWEDEEADLDASGDTYVSGIWEGDVGPYAAASVSVAVPPRFEEAVQRKAELFAALLALLKEPAQPMALGETEFVRWLPRAMAMIAEAETIDAKPDGGVR